MTDPRPSAGRVPLIAGFLMLALGAWFDGARPDQGWEATSVEPAWDPALLRRLADTLATGAGGSRRDATHRVDPDPAPTLSGTPGRPPRLAPRESGEGIAALLDFAGDPADLETMGFRIFARRGRGYAVEGGSEAFDRLRRVSGQLRLARLARPVSARLDLSLPRLGLAQVRNIGGPPWLGPTGRGVVVGIVDTGLDIHHPDFRRADGTSRVVAFWDQTVAHVSADVPIGAVYRPPALDGFLATATAAGIGFDRDGHGTHVAGIAGGSGSAHPVPGTSQFVGVAPEVEFIIVRTYFNEAAVVGAVDFIFREADRLGRPAVVNLSLGHQYGPHDGTGIFERLLSEMCGPGRLLVVAAGNEGGMGIHASLPGGSGPDSVSFNVPVLPNPGDLVNVVGLDAWGPTDVPHRFTLVFPDGRRFGPFLPGRDYLAQGGDHALNAEQVRYEFGRNFSLDLRLFSRRWPSGIFHLVVESAGRGARAPLHFWIPYSDLNGPRTPAFVRGRDERGTLSEPANGFNVLSVAATVSRNCWLSASRADSVCTEPPGRPGVLVSYSSLGPTPDGRLKPEVAAPGDGIASALSASMSAEAAAARNLPLRLMPDLRHWVNSGTSMAAPHLTGALALLLERIPGLTPDVARERLRLTSLPLEAPPGTHVGGSLELGRFLRPSASAGFATLAPIDERRARIVWNPVLLDGLPALFRIARGTSPRGPFDIVGGADGPAPAAGPRVIDDGPLEPGRTYYYRLSVVDPSGLDEPLDTLAVTLPGSPRLALVGPRINPGPLPVQFSLFLPETVAPLSYRIEIFDTQGRWLAEPARGTWGPAAVEIPISWDGRVASGRRLGAGLVFARLTAGGESRAVKVVIRG